MSTPTNAATAEKEVARMSSEPPAAAEAAPAATNEVASTPSDRPEAAQEAAGSRRVSLSPDDAVAVRKSGSQRATSPSASKDPSASKETKRITEEQRSAPIFATVVTTSKALGQVYFFIEVYEDASKLRSYFLRTYEEIVKFDHDLKDSVASRGGKMSYGKAGKIREKPGDLPEPERFGFRRSLSSLGLGDFNVVRQVAIQEYFNTVLCQVGNLREEPMISEFFAEDAPIFVAGRSDHEQKALRILADGLKADFTARTAEEVQETVYEDGSLVRIVGLHKTTEYNNKTGKVISHEAGSYKIRMVDGRAARVKACNVRVVIHGRADAQNALEAEADKAAKEGQKRRSSVAMMLGFSDDP